MLVAAPTGQNSDEDDEADESGGGSGSDAAPPAPETSTLLPTASLARRGSGFSSFCESADACGVGDASTERTAARLPSWS